MSIFARFQAIEEEGKAKAIRVLMENSTPDFDFFYIIALSVLMATLGLLADSPTVVIGSMLIAPILFPILGSALGLVMSDHQVLSRSLSTLIKAFAISIGVAAGATLFFSPNGEMTDEILLRTEPSLLYFVIAITAGLAVSYALVRPNLNETLPGIAISVALIPPLAVVGIGLAKFSWSIVSGSAMMLIVNISGIIFASMVSFSLMNLHDKRKIANSTIRKEDERLEEENIIIANLREKQDAAENK